MLKTCADSHSISDERSLRRRSTDRNASYQRAAQVSLCPLRRESRLRLLEPVRHAHLAVDRHRRGEMFASLLESASVPE